MKLWGVKYLYSLKRIFLGKDQLYVHLFLTVIERPDKEGINNTKSEKEIVGQK